jgi:hypothetical protein
MTGYVLLKDYGKDFDVFTANCPDIKNIYIKSPDLT